MQNKGQQKDCPNYKDMDNKKYYWLKLKKNFFKRHDITIIENMPNGKDYILFYLKLLVESLDHSGNLRFSDTIPYNEEMLSSLTGTNIDVVRSALKIFTNLELIEILDDETIYMTEVNKLTGCETVWAEKKRNYRLEKKDNVLKIEDNVRTEKDNVRQEIRDKRKDNIYVSSEADTIKSDDDFEVEIENHFNFIREKYPKVRRGSKAKALKIYKKYITTGHKYCDRNIKLTEKQIFQGVMNYIKAQENNNTEPIYYKNFETLMNQISDFLEVENGK